MGSLRKQITVLFLCVWSISVISCASLHNGEKLLHSSYELDDNSFYDQLPKSRLFWTNNKDDGPSVSSSVDEDDSGNRARNNQLFEKDQYSLPSMYELKKHLEHPSQQLSSSHFDSTQESSSKEDPEGNGMDSAPILDYQPLSPEGNYGKMIARPVDDKVKLDAIGLHGINKLKLLANLRNHAFPRPVVLSSRDPAGQIGTDMYRTTNKRSPMCLRKCMAQGLLHPAQCHSLC